MPALPDLFAQALNGLSYGVLLFLLSVGLTLIFGMLDVVNLAHGSFYMLGAYAGLTLIATTGNFWLAPGAAPPGVGGSGAGIARGRRRLLSMTAPMPPTTSGAATSASQKLPVVAIRVSPA